MSDNSLTKAQKLHQQGHLDEALDLYQQLLEEDPKQADVLHSISILLAQTKHSDPALTLVQQALVLEPQNSAYLNTLGNLQLRLKKYDDAITTFERAIAFEPEAAGAYINLGNVYRQQDNIDAAIVKYENAISIDSKHIDAHYNLAICLMIQEKWDAAIHEYKATLLYAPKHPGAHGQLAQIYLQTTQPEKAIIHFKKRLEFQPNHADTHHDLALAYLETKYYQKALDALLLALELNPKLCDVHYHIATANIHLGEFTDALKYYLRQLEIKPYEECYFNIAVLLMYEGRAREAFDYFQKTLDYNPDHFDTHINLGVMHLRSNNKAEAITHYQKALSVRPNDKEALHILSAIEQKNTADTAPSEYIEHLFDQYAPYYDVHLQEQLKYQAPQIIKDVLAANTQLIQCEYDVVDLGCGTGLMGSAIKPYCKTLRGIDISDNMVSIARSKNIYQELLTASLLDGLEQLGQFDLMIAADVFSYIGNLADTLAACKKHLQQGGYLIFTVEQSYQTDQFILQETIRYAHNPKYLNALRDSLGFSLIEQRNIVLREQNKQAVEGLLFLWSN